MDTGIVFALVLAALFFGAILWLVIYSRTQGRKHTVQTSIRPRESSPKDKAA